MKIFKHVICKIWNTFNLPKFSQSPEIKISKRKTFEIVPTKEYQRIMNEYFKDFKVYVNGKEIVNGIEQNRTEMK